MAETEKIVYLEILSFIGIGIGASHYYGSLWGYKDGEMEKVKLIFILTTRGAAKLNKLHGKGSGYHAGMEWHGFDSQEAIIKLAKQTYKEHFPHANILISGSIAVADPQPVLDGPAEFMERVNKWVEEADRINWYDGKHEKRMNTISDQFSQYI